MARNEISVVVDVKGRIDNFRAAAEQMQGYLNKLELPKMAENKSASIFSQLSREIEKIQNLTAKGKIDLIDDKNIKTAYHNIENLIGQLEDLSNSPAVRGAWSKDLIQGWNKANSAIKDYMASMKELENRQAKLQGARAGAQGRLNTASAKKQNLLETAGIRQTKYEKQIIEQSEAQGRVAAQAYQRAYETYLSQHPTSKFHKLGQDAWKNSLSKGQIAEINKTMTDKNVVNEADLAKALKLDETRVKLDGIKQIIDDIINNKRIDIGAAAEHGMTGEAKAYNLDLPNVQKIQQEIDAIDDSLNKITQEAAPKFNELRQQLLQIQGIDWSKILPQGKDLNNASIEEIVQSLANFAAAQNEAVDNSTELKKSFENVARGAREVSQPLEKAGEDLETLRERSQNAQQTLSRLQYYFSSVSVFMLFRRAIRSARDAVKELDDAMTETAVVTNYTISDLWKKLPEYTKRANELGVSTLAAYQSATLYYQQGLNDTQVSEMSVETLKMARIAGIEAADATNLMTGAIRAFNMEINKMSAQRVNDVYNKLAAMTAANTEGIATAMTKVASIAHSVGAEFENVAAFLAQMIETTQEAPETLGTALKTVFARFAEVKKLYSEGQITGSDEEGEEINVNKIQEALRTVGISMTDFLVGNEGLDQVIMRLAQKWDSLDTVTQRYIATMAAGSRQQSRFISLLQDFGRTQELINAANNSEGAAQNQFEKTLDSLQSKTEQLRNAWNEFLLDLANSDAIKGVVDLLNNLVTALNKITGALGSGGSGIAKLLLGLGILKGGRALLGGAKTMFDPAMLDKFGGSRTKAFRYGAASQMGFDETNYSPSNSLGGALLKRKGAQFKGFGTSFKNTFIKEEREKTKAANEGTKVRLANARKEYKEKEQLNEEAQNRLIKARENYNKIEQKQGEFASVSPEKEELNKAEADAASANQEYLKAQKEVTEASQPAGEKLMQYGQTMQIVGQAAGIAAGACFMLANSLEQSGNTKAAKTFKTLGTTLGVLSAVFMMVGSVAQITGAQIAAGAKTASTAIMNIPIIGWIAAVIAGLVALISIIANFVESEAERLERLHEATERTKNAAEAAANAYDELLSTHKDYNTRLEEVQKLTKGTEEYKQAIKDLNEEVLALVRQYPDLEITFDAATGVLSISKEAWDKIQQASAEQVKNTAFLAGVSSAIEQGEIIRQRIATTRTSFGSTQINPEATAGYGFEKSLVAELTDSEVVALSNLGITRDDLEKLMSFVKNNVRLSNGKAYNDFYESDTRRVQGYQKEVEDIYYKELRKRINGADENINPYGEVDATIQNAIFSSSDTTKPSSFTVSKFFTAESFADEKWTKSEHGGETTEWYRKDWERKTDEGVRYWDILIDTALERGLISETKAATYRTNSQNKEYNRELYAAFTGQSLSEVNEMNWDPVLNDLGNIFKTVMMSKEFEKNQKAFENLPPNLQEAITTAFTDPNNLNNAQIKLINDNFNNLFGYYDEKTGDFVEGKLANVDTSDLEAILKNIKWVGPSEIIDENSEYWEYYTRDAETMWKNLNKYGEDFGNAYSGLFKQIVNNDDLTKQQKENALGILNSANIRDSKDLWNTIKLLKDEGIDLTKIGLDGAFTEFINSLEKAGIAVKKWSKELADSSIKSSRSLKNSIESGELEYTWSKEQYEELEGLLQKTENADLLNNFTENLDGTYTYSSSDLNPIINALNSIDNILGKEYKERLEKKAEVSDEVQNIKNQEFGTAWRNMTHFSGYTQTASFGDNRSEIEQATKEQQLKYYNLILQGLIEAGIDSSTLNELDLPQNITEDLIGEYLPNLLDLIFNNEEIHKELISGIGITSGQGLLYHSALGDQEKEDAYKRLKGTVLTDETASGALAKWGETSLLDENIEKMDDLDAATLALAKDYASLTKVIKSTGEALGNQIENLKAGPEIGEDYYNSLAETQKALKKLFGKDFTEEEIKDLLPTIEKFTQGSEEAFNELAEVASQKWIPDLDDSVIEQYNSIIAQMEGAEVGVKVGLDATTVQATEADMEDLRQALAAKGIVANWTDLGQVPGSPDGLHSYQLNFAVNGGGGFTPKKSGGGGGGKTSPWENPYDKYHNLLQEIDELLRTRNDLERQYEKILANRHSTIQDILKNSRENLANLEREIVAQKMLQKGRQEQFRNLAKDDYYFDEKGKRRSFAQQAAEFGINLSDYARYNEETQEMEINWGAFEEVERRSETDAKWAEVGKFLEKYYDKLKELTDSYEDTQDTIEEMEDEIQEILERSKEDYLDFEQELYDALVDHVQQYIDAEQKLSDTIKDAETKVLDHLRESIDLERQIRDNTKTEEDIADKENRLAYLQRDTTGANAVEIMQLQKEIQEARENYQDTLVDQELERLNRISEEAAQQREHQIELMQEQLDWAQKAGYFWNEVESILQTALKSGDTSLIEQLLKGVGDFNEKSMFGDRAWKDELIERFLKASEGRANWELDNAKENHTSWASRIAATGKEGTVGIWWDAEKKQWVDAKGNTYTGVGYDVQTGTWKYENRSDRVKDPPSSGGSGAAPQPQSGQNEKPKQKTYNVDTSSERKAEIKTIYGNSGKYKTESEAQAAANGLNSWDAVQENNSWVAKPVGAGNGFLKFWAQALAERLNRTHILQYATGGLATQTGPAWLDGTPSKPEYVLNAAQTQAFLQLADVLPSMVSGGSSLTNAPTAVNIDIDINVDSIANDYDVDRLCDRVKEDLYSDLMYRNINVVNLRR